MKKLWILLWIVMLALAGCAPIDLPDKSELVVHFIDVGQGDCQLIQSVGHAILIDAGERTEADHVITYIERLGIETLDYVIATHPHSDHIGGLPKVIDRFTVRNVMMPKVSASSETFRKLLLSIQNKGLTIQEPVVGEKIELDDLSITILGPVEIRHDNINNNSIAARLVYGQTSFLFTGDAEEKAENELLHLHGSLRSDILSVGHHGSRTSTSEDFLKAVKPKAAVISSGSDNPYGHPDDEVIERLEKYDILVFRTDKMGDIKLTSDGKTITYTTGVE